MNNKAWALIAQHNYAQAISFFEKALTIDPNFKTALTGKQLAMSQSTVTHHPYYSGLSLFLPPLLQQPLGLPSLLQQPLGSTTSSIPREAGSGTAAQIVVDSGGRRIASDSGSSDSSNSDSRGSEELQAVAILVLLAMYTTPDRRFYPIFIPKGEPKKTRELSI